MIPPDHAFLFGVAFGALLVLNPVLLVWVVTVGRVMPGEGSG